MTTLLVREAAQSQVRAPHTARRSIYSAWYVVATLLVAFGSALGATTATRWLLRDMQPRRTATTPHLAAPLPVWQNGLAAGAGDPLTVGIGATQSYDGLAITVDNLRIVAAHNFVGAPPGSNIAIVTVTLVNTDPVQALAYNAADYWLSDAAGASHHEIFAALDAPLGAGNVAPLAQAIGDVAFLVTATPDATAPDPQIVFAPPAAQGFVLRWDLPLMPTLP